MSEVKIKARREDIVRFPGICVHCTQPATERLSIRKRIGRVTRFIDVPLCTACAQVVSRRSAVEEQLQKAVWLAVGIVGILLFAVGLLLTPSGMAFSLRLFIAGGVAAAAATAVWLLFRRAQAQAALPEKKAILSAARIETFSWRATTFTFENTTFAERFQTLNQSILFNQ